MVYYKVSVYTLSFIWSNLQSHQNLSLRRLSC